MPVPTRFGAYAQRTATSLSFVGSLAINGTNAAQAVTMPVGTHAGDLVLIFDVNLTTTPSISGSTGWTTSSLAWTNYGYVTGLSQKVVVSGDLAGVTANGFAGRTILVLAYRGATLATAMSANPGSAGTTLTLAGFTKSVGCKGVLSLVQDRDDTSSPSPPGTMVSRAAGTYANWSAASADIINPASYVNGTAIVWTGFDAGFDQIGGLLELT